MRRKIVKPLLSMALVAAMLLSAFQMIFFVSAADADVISDSAANSFANWEGIAADGSVTTRDALISVKDEVWKTGRTLQSVEVDLKSVMAGDGNKFVRFVYDYNGPDDYRYVEFRETGSKFLMLSAVDCVAGVATAPKATLTVNSPQGTTGGNLLHTVANGITAVKLGFEVGAKVRIDYQSAESVMFTFTSKDGAAVYNLNIAPQSGKNIDFTDTDNRFYIYVSAAAADVVVNSIDVSFVADAAFDPSKISDSAENGFANWNGIEPDGTVVSRGTPISVKDSVWSNYAGKAMQSVELDLKADIKSSAAKNIRLVYDYTDAQNYKCLEFREAGTGNLYFGVVDVVNGTATKPTDVASDKGGLNTAAGNDSKTAVGLLTGAKIRIDYVSAGQVVFTFSSYDGSKVFAVTVTATSGDYAFTSGRFYLVVSQDAVNPVINSSLITFVTGAQDAAEAFKAKYADVLTDDVTAEDLPAVREAMRAYAELEEDTKALLTAEYAQLSANFGKLIAATGKYSCDFTNGVDGWEQYADFHNDNGDVIVQKDYTVTANEWIGGISQPAVDEHVLKVDTSLVSTDYATTEYTSGQYQKGQCSVAMISPNRGIWNAAKAAGKTFTGAEFDILTSASLSVGGLMITYRYNNEYDYSYFLIGRQTATKIQVTNVMIKQDENGDRDYVGRGSVSYQTTMEFDDWTVNNNNWLHGALTYDADGYAVLSLTGNAGNTFSFSSGANNADRKVADQEKVIAFGMVPVFNNGDRTGTGNQKLTAVDNFVMHMGGAEDISAEEFKQQYKNTLNLDTDAIAPYDVTEIKVLSDAYDALDDGVKAALTEVKATIDTLNAKAAEWDLTGDQTVADCYKALWTTEINSGDAAKVQAAWKVYNRLTAAQKALLADEYQAMVTAMRGFAQVTDDKVQIACLGDSLTFGSGSTSAANNSYPAKLQALLGDGYTVSKYGIAGIRVLNETNLTATNDTTLQFEAENRSEWTVSHNGAADIVIVQLGTNDLKNVVNGGENGKAVYTAAFEKLIQSYLKLDNAPLIIISNTPKSFSGIASGAYTEAQATTVAKINMAIAEKYGLPCLDLFAFTNTLTGTDVDTYYNADHLHFNDAGYQKLAEMFADAIQSFTVEFDTAAVTGFTFEDNRVNSHLAPELISATIRENADPAKQDIRYKSQFSAAVKTGATIVEYGTIFTPYQDGVTDLGKMVYNALPEDNILIAKRTGVTENVAGQTYYASLGGVKVKNAYIARSYVRYSDGSVYYSINSAPDGDYNARKGVKDGYACRSAVSIAKAMTIFLAENDVDISEVGAYQDGVLQWNAGATDNDGAAIFDFLTRHAEDIRNLVGE